jgi:hypothetical protein
MAKGQGLPIVFALVAALACAREGVPIELIGRWTTDDPRYADRSLDISAEKIAFGVGSGTRMTYRVQGIERESDPATGTLFRLFYDAPGEPERILQVKLPRPGHLYFENHTEPWTRSSASSEGG